ncbi:MAG: hypothetical protein DMG73_17120 [Acidobacteria bacterium]|nr:MAG: hypothetical protein DMG73_17120 [Acidobacteriota bacterium]PYX67202.1 MAG: hypothetical protein DMG74_01115 [Acidobacteriota bacterium]
MSPTINAYLSVRGIIFEDRDVSVNNSASQELISKCGSRSMPTVVIGAR